MAIAPTGAIYKTLTFDGVSSADFGVYITGEAVFNAPQRDVEMVTIPGRNGTFALDNGRFENIEVSYPAGIFADTEADFAEAVSEFRNFLCSRNGYVRLEDDYNASEYRMAVYKSGLEVTPALLKAGEFTLTFDCKPQRWLTSGETAISVDSGDTITNPTRFESGPMLEVEGYGNISFNGYEIALADAVMGDVVVADGTRISGTYASKSWRTAPLRNDLYNYEDTVTWKSSSVAILISGGANVRQITSVLVSKSGLGISYSISQVDSKNYTISIAVQDYIVREDVDGSAAYITVTVHFIDSNGNSQTEQNRFEIHLALKKTYQNGGNYSFYAVPTSSYFTYLWSGIVIGDVVADSTISILGHPTYIDCDLGEAYMIKDGSTISLNQYIDLGSDLPVLASGENEITFDNTITNLDVIPRWWKV